MKKYALIFPGIGYHCDKPLLYYSKKIAKKYGYKVVEVPYKGFPSGVKGDVKRMEEAFQLALSQTEEILKDVNVKKAKEILIISKSIGTAVAAAYQTKHGLSASNIYFTPVEQSFSLIPKQSGIVFHGTGDSWADTDKLIASCKKLNLLCYLTEDADHSMEIGNPVKDLATMQQIMTICEDYIRVLEA